MKYSVIHGMSIQLEHIVADRREIIMKKLRIVLVTLMVSILLSACGNSQTNDSDESPMD